MFPTLVSIVLLQLCQESITDRFVCTKSLAVRKCTTVKKSLLLDTV